MKNSFSMSSLQPSIRGRLEQSDHAANVTPVLPNRAYNSLNHKLKYKFVAYYKRINRTLWCIPMSNVTYGVFL